MFVWIIMDHTPAKEKCNLLFQHISDHQADPLSLQVCCEEAEGDEGGLNAALVILITSPQLAGIRQNCDGADSEPRYFLFHTVPPDITPCGRFRCSGSALVTSDHRH